jgi:hypothetical protein
MLAGAFMFFSLCQCLEQAAKLKPYFWWQPTVTKALRKIVLRLLPVLTG